MSVTWINALNRLLISRRRPRNNCNVIHTHTHTHTQIYISPHLQTGWGWDEMQLLQQLQWQQAARSSSQLAVGRVAGHSRRKIRGSVKGKVRNRCLSAIKEHSHHRISLKYRITHHPARPPDPLCENSVCGGVRTPLPTPPPVDAPMVQHCKPVAGSDWLNMTSYWCSILVIGPQVEPLSR